MVTTWNNSDKASMTVSGANNLTATANNSGVSSIRSTSSKPVGGGGGKYMFEITMGNNTNDWCCGIADGTFSLSITAGNDTHAMVLYADPTQHQLVYFNSASFGFSSTFDTNNGDIMTFCVDTVNALFWFTSPQEQAFVKAGTNTWNNSGTDSPGTSGGFSFSGIGSPIYILFNDDLGSGSGSCTLNTGATAFSRAIPSGFSAWDNSVPASGRPRLIILD